MKETFWTIMAGTVVIAIIFVLVRPGSPASGAIADVTGAMAAAISLAINGTNQENSQGNNNG